MNCPECPNETYDGGLCGSCLERQSQVVKAAAIVALAKEQWARFDKNERGVMRIGMSPFWTHQELESKLATIGERAGVDECRDHALALMDCTKEDGGMVV